MGKGGLVAILVLGVVSLPLRAHGAYSWRERGLRPTSFTRSGEIIWTYESVSLGKQQAFSYLKQDYGLNIWGPLIFPAFGQSKIYLNYGLGKNMLDSPSLTRNRQKFLSYNLDLLLAPRGLERFIVGNVTLGRAFQDEFDVKKTPLSSRINSFVSTNLTFGIPGRLNLSRLISGNNNRTKGRSRSRKGDFFVFSFPYISYTYTRGGFDGELFSRLVARHESITQDWRVFYDFHRLRLNYHEQTNKRLDLLQNSLLDHSFSRIVEGNLSSGDEFLGIFQSASLNANYSQNGTLTPRRDYPSGAGLGTSLATKTLKVAGLTSSMYLNNGVSWRENSGVYQITNNLFLNTYAYLGKTFLQNTLGYSFSVLRPAPGMHSVNEKFSLTYAPWRLVRLGGSASQALNWNETRTKGEEYGTSVDFTPFSFLGSSFYSGISRASDLTKKKLLADNRYLRLSVGGKLSPLGYFLDFFNNNNNNHKGNGNNTGKRNNHNGWNGNILTFDYGFSADQTEDLLARTTSLTLSLSQACGIHLAPLNDLLVIDLRYQRIEGRKDGTRLPAREYFTASVTSRAGLFYRGLSFTINLATTDLRTLRANLELGGEYRVGRTRFGFKYRLIGSNVAVPARILSASLARTF